VKDGETDHQTLIEGEEEEEKEEEEEFQLKQRIQSFCIFSKRQTTFSIHFNRKQF
jgi:hypothetical protein